MLMVEFWRSHLDPDKRFKLAFDDFAAKLRNVGYEHVSKLWKAIVKGRREHAIEQAERVRYMLSRTGQNQMGGTVSGNDDMLSPTHDAVGFGGADELRPPDSPGITFKGAGDVSMVSPVHTGDAWSPSQKNIAAGYHNSEFEPITLRDLDPGAHTFITHFMFKLIRKILAQRQEYLTIQYAGKLAGRKWKADPVADEGRNDDDDMKK